MGLPKNFQKTVNLNNRVKALNDLTFYVYEYEVKLTNNTINEVYDNNKSFEDLVEFLGEINFVDNKLARCSNRISALDREKADKKVDEWLTKAIESNIIEGYKIVGVDEKSFTEELEDKKLTDILNFKRD
jgi:hypothetical protein